MLSRNNERGSVTLVLAVFSLVLLLIVAVALDFGLARVRAARMQTALDAATLAGAMSSDRWGDYTVHASRYHHDTCTESWVDEKGQKHTRTYDCSWWEAVSFPLHRVKADEADAVAQSEATARGLRYDGITEDRAWAELRPGPEPEAEATAAYWANSPWAGADAPRVARGGQATVRAEAGGCWPTVFLRLFGVRELCLHRSAEATAMAS